MEKTRKALDDRSYRFRWSDAVQYSRDLNWEYSKSLAKPPAAPLSRIYVSQRQAAASQESRDSYFCRLQKQVPEDYAVPEDKQKYSEPEGDGERHGEPERKKQKKMHERVIFEKRSLVDEERKENKEILMKLQKKFEKRQPGGTGSFFGAMKTRAVTIEAMRKPIDRETKEGQAMHAELTSNDSSESNEAISSTAKARGETIAELEAEIQTLQISRAEDHLFYDRFAQREANTILEKILHKALDDLAVEVFDEEEEKSRNKELPPELLEIVEDALHEGPMDEVLIQKYNVNITRRDLQVLLPGVWLNDEVINFYYQMMNDRDEALVKAGVLAKRSHFFNSFFYTKVSENGYNFINVRRWTRKIDLFSMDKIFIPVNVGNMHWTMAVIFMTEKRIQYFDSMHGSGAACIKVLFKYLHEESEHKKKQKFDDEGWELVTCTPDTPVQNNGSDCGVFSCMFADYLAANRPLSFSQKDIPFHRHRMILHVSRGYIPLDEEGL